MATYQLEEATFQPSVTAAVGEERTKGTSPTTTRRQLLGKDDWRRQSGPDRSIDGALETRVGHTGCGQIEDRARRRGAPEPIDVHPIGGPPAFGGVHVERHGSAPRGPDDGQLGGSRITTEAVQVCRRFVADRRVLSETQHAGEQSLPHGRWCADDGVHPRRDRREEALATHRASLRVGVLERAELVERDHPGLFGGELGQLRVARMGLHAVPVGPDDRQTERATHRRPSNRRLLTIPRTSASPCRQPSMVWRVTCVR